MAKGQFPSDQMLWVQILKGLMGRREDFLCHFAHGEQIGFLVLFFFFFCGCSHSMQKFQGQDRTLTTAAI